MSSKKHKLKKKAAAHRHQWQPLVRNLEAEERGQADRAKHHHYDEIWVNDIYCVMVRRAVSGFGESGQPVMTWLSIKRHDRAACNDWRDFQFIKNQLCGPEHEGAQLYPAESRLIDGSNQYHIWVLEDTEDRFPFGFNDGRRITEQPFPGGKQRPFPNNMKPDDLPEQEELAERDRQQWIKDKQG